MDTPSSRLNKAQPASIAHSATPKDTDDTQQKNSYLNKGDDFVIPDTFLGTRTTKQTVTNISCVPGSIRLYNILNKHKLDTLDIGSECLVDDDFFKTLDSLLADPNKKQIVYQILKNNSQLFLITKGESYGFKPESTTESVMSFSGASISELLIWNQALQAIENNSNDEATKKNFFYHDQINKQILEVVKGYKVGDYQISDLDIIYAIIHRKLENKLALTTPQTYWTVSDKPNAGMQKQLGIDDAKIEEMYEKIITADPTDFNLEQFTSDIANDNFLKTIRSIAQLYTLQAFADIL